MTLAEAAVDAVRDWKFEPYMQNRHPVRVQQDLTFNFRSSGSVAELDPNLPSPIPVSRIRKVPDTPTSDPQHVFRVGVGVTAPKAIIHPDPKYDKQAKKEKIQGICLLSLIVGPDGQPRDIKVARALGHGMDVKAIEAVNQWKFEPATLGGKPVAVLINVEVNFRLY